MATARITCGQCGASLSSPEKVCPECGASIELPFATASVNDQGSAARCPACGHKNTNPGSFCESCGAPLPGQRASGTTHLPEHSSPHAGKRKGKQSANREKKKGLSREHAPILGVAILVLGVFLYNELTRDPGSPKIQAASSSPASSPVDQKAIDELQEVVDANPGDGPSLLRLANKLQDQSTHDPKLLYRAADAYRKYLAINPSGQDPRVDLGICYFEISRNNPADGNDYLHMALQEMENVYKANPHHQAAAFNLGIVQLNAGNLDEASEWLRRAASIDPNSDLGQRAKKLLDEHTFGASTNQQSQNQ